MKNQKTLITIIIPCYNCAQTVPETLKSILEQTYRNYEIILINDGSTDNTLNTILDYSSSDIKISVFNQENKGQSAARNVGLLHARGKYVVCIDSDDSIAPSFLEECLERFMKNDDAIIVYTDLSFFERESGRFQLSDFDLSEFLITNCIPVCAMVHLEQMKAIGGFDENMSTNEDWECWIRLIRTFKGRVVKINKPLYYYRKRLTNNSVSDLSIQSNNMDDSFKYVYNKHYDFYLSNGLGVWDLFNVCISRGLFKSKYYNIWYKKWYYKIFNRSKYQSISNSTSFFRWK